MLRLQVVAAKEFERSEIEAVVGAHDDSGAGAASADLCQSHCVGEGVEASASILLGNVYTHQAQLTHLLHSLCWELSRPWGQTVLEHRLKHFTSILAIIIIVGSHYTKHHPTLCEGMLLRVIYVPEF